MAYLVKAVQSWPGSVMDVGSPRKMRQHNFSSMAEEQVRSYL